MRTLQSRIADEVDFFLVEPDTAEKELTGWCCACERNVDIAEEDHGIGSYEYWGSHEVHHDWRNTCQECGSTDVEVARAEVCHD